MSITSRRPSGINLETPSECSKTWREPKENKGSDWRRLQGRFKSWRPVSSTWRPVCRIWRAEGEGHEPRSWESPARTHKCGPGPGPARRRNSYQSPDARRRAVRDSEQYSEYAKPTSSWDNGEMVATAGYGLPACHQPKLAKAGTIGGKNKEGNTSQLEVEYSTGTVRFLSEAIKIYPKTK